jgi:hypothetical protein
MPLLTVNKSGAPTPISQEDLENAELGAVSGGLLKVSPDLTGIQFAPKSKSEAITDVATLPLYLYGGPETREGAGFLERNAYRGIRAGITGTETVASDIAQGVGRKLRGQPSGLSLKGEALRFDEGVAFQPLAEAASGLASAASGLPKARAEAAQMTADRDTKASDIAEQKVAGGAKLIAESDAIKRIRTILGGTDPKAPPEIINQGTRDSQNALWHSINSIHRDINSGYERLFAPYKKNTTNAETLAAPLIDLRTQLETQGRDSQLGAPTRKLLNDAIELGSPDPLLAHFSAEDLAKMSPKEKEGLRGYFAHAKAEIAPAEGASTIQGRGGPKNNEKKAPGPTVDQLLTMQSRAQQILRNPSASATDKSVASRVFRSAQGSLDELGDSAFLSPAEKQQHLALKAQTRSFYTDFGDLMRGSRTQTPGALGDKLLKQPPHVIARIVDSATAQPEALEHIRRSVADAIVPRSEGDVAKTIGTLTKLDRDGTLAKLYPGRYGHLGDWISTLAAERRLAAQAASPMGRAAVQDGLKDAMATPEGRAFIDQYSAVLSKLQPEEQKLLSMASGRQALDESLKKWAEGGFAKGKMGWAARYLGIMAPIEAAMGFGILHKMPGGVPASLFIGAAGSMIWKAAMRNDKTRAAFLSAITDKNIRRASSAIARIGMGAALEELRQVQPSDDGDAYATQ